MCPLPLHSTLWGAHVADFDRGVGCVLDVSLHLSFTFTLTLTFTFTSLSISTPPPHTQIQHEDSVTSGCVSPDGIKVAVGTAHGSVGVLDVSTHAYDTLMRSHAKTIVAVASRPSKHLAFHGRVG